ncbi:MAG TPA: type II CAAX endopeptidase family protein [Isosphaeraceae bacterium]
MPPQPTPAQVTVSLVVLGLLSTMLAVWFWAIGRLASGKTLLPPAPVRVVPWRAKHVLGMVLLYIAIINIVPPLVFAALGVKPAKGDGAKLDPATLMMTMIAVNGTFVAVGPLLLAWWTKAGPADFGVERGKVGRDILRGIVAWPLLAPIVFGVQYLSLKVWPPQKHPLLELVEGDPTSLNWGLTILSAVVLAPLAEEFLFRGVLLGWLGRWAAGVDRPKPATALDPDLGPPENWYEPEPAPAAGHGWRLLAANVAVSGLFAAMHAQVWPTPIPLFFLSLGLGILYQRTGGLVAPVTLHATFNGISTLMLYMMLQVNPDALKPGGPVPIPPEAALVRQDVDLGRHASASRHRNLNSLRISVDRTGAHG